jgi:hypothetical protein
VAAGTAAHDILNGPRAVYEALPKSNGRRM